MAKLRVCCFAVSVDGFGAGPDQELKNPLGVGCLQDLNENSAPHTLGGGLRCH